MGKHRVSIGYSNSVQAIQLFKLMSSAGTGYFYVGSKHSRHMQRKLTLRKYDPIVDRHVIFYEQKLKNPKRK